jgi:hypothetical protein
MWHTLPIDLIEGEQVDSLVARIEQCAYNIPADTIRLRIVPPRQLPCCYSEEVDEPGPISGLSLCASSTILPENIADITEGTSALAIVIRGTLWGRTAY